MLFFIYEYEKISTGLLNENHSVYSGIVTQTEEDIFQSWISENRSFLIEEIDTDGIRRMLEEKTGNKLYLGISNSLSRRETATQIYDILATKPPYVRREDFIEILKELNMDLVLKRLEAYSRIFSYNNGK